MKILLKMQDLINFWYVLFFLSFLGTAKKINAFSTEIKQQQKEAIPKKNQRIIRLKLNFQHLFI